MNLKQNNNYLGTWLVREGVITQEQLDNALSSQSLKQGKKAMIGHSLIELGYCSEDDIAKVIAKRAGVSFVSLENYPIDPAALTTISNDAIKRYRALPIAFSKGKLLVAMQRPTDIMVIDDLRLLSGFDIKPVFAPDSELEVAIEKQIRASIEFDKTEEEIIPEEDILGASEDSDQKPAVQLANMIISQAVAAKCSDVHIEPYEKASRVRFRIDGVLHDVMEPPIKYMPPWFRGLRLWQIWI
ncbi:hypothetical protein N752_13290 [Desulforamulus aquiferis]|nr:ATPase, T2SS/T4P/T4SS family [Desulforamulus aquiferis]RYD04342.1 hypothetical protein N752_13290 [Desulforamulus aquiferis]